MKMFKKIDLWISILLMGFFFIYSLIRIDGTFLYAYLMVGSWQLISMLVHQFKGYFTTKHYSRHYYHILIVLALILLIVGWVIYPLAFWVLIVLLFAAPIMAVIYTVICYNELTIHMKRPLDDLK